MNELKLFSKMSEISDHPQEASLLFQDDGRAQLIAEHKLWLKSIRHERPSPAHHFKIGIANTTKPLSAAMILLQYRGCWIMPSTATNRFCPNCV